MTGSASVLAPLRARYASWLSLPEDRVADTSDEDPATVRAMQLVMRIERQDPPRRTDVLEAAAAAAVAVCLDPRSRPGGEWHDEVAAWVTGRIRKVARRARGAHWAAAQDVPGLTVTVGTAQVRALVPGLVSAVPKVISRLQISGTDLPADDPEPPQPGDGPVLWINPEVPMTVGKAAAQVGHGSMLLASALGPRRLAEWAATGFRCVVRTPSVEHWRQLLPGDDPAGAWERRRVLAVRDAGYTEIAPGTITVLAVDPGGRSG
ncbi:MAG: peptidyl-tRNA hydrolase [Thermocrispum agreste]|jgi:peptidyl-tRNA hydrolase|uniref:peptidyl-tRNA hydrolase n=2 Tax=Thermocrispum agreste TaxID=37925 RepID=A0ABD6FCU4_9PSEU